MKRAGKLLYVTGGDSALTALDALSGAVVWRMRDPLRFCGGITLDHDLLYAVAGGEQGRARLYAVDAFSGHVRWSSDVAVQGNGNAAITVEGAPLLADGAVALAVRDRNGSSLVAFDRLTGDPLWRVGGSSLAKGGGTAWLGIDDLYVGNCATGELIGVEAKGGAVRYRLALGRSLEEDTPRRLEPVLRSGALFVPHTDVHVFRPRDGAPLGSIAPCDAIPDLLRVDERCDVYVAEESGHLVSFGAGPRLSLVR
jgi:outer membrane protein assembly factor BamB